MKKLFLLALCVILQSSIINHQSFAQAPKKMNYQGVVRDADGQTLVNKTVNLRLSILSAADINNPSYTEVQTVTTNAFGLFAIKIGEGNAIVGEMNNINWSSADHFVSVELDVDNNGHFQFMGTSQLLSVPYAFYAETAGKAIDLENADQYRDIPFSGTSGQTIRSNGQEWEASSVLFNISSKIGIGTTVPSEKLHVNGNINLTQGNEIKIGGERALKLDANRNMMQGEQAGNALTSGVNNNFIGNRAGRVNTTGSNNSFIGYRAGLNNTTGDGNMFLGYRAGHFNTTGSNNFYGGLNAGYNSTTGLNNIALGTNAGFNLGDGKDNTLVGRDAGFNTTGNRNAFIGKDAGKSNTTGFNNTYIGYNTSGVDTLENATAIGANTSVTASNSVVLGNNANVGVGTSAPSDKLHVVGNIRMVDGNQAAGYIPVADSNGVMTWTSPSSISHPSLSDTDDDTKILVEQTPDNDEIRFYIGGTQKYRMRGNALEVSNMGNSIYVGTHAGSSDDLTNNANIGIGTSALDDNTSGANNIALGYLSMLFNTTGYDNIAIGSSSLWSNITGWGNLAIGGNSLDLNTTGSENIAIGQNAMKFNNTAAANIAIGNSALVGHGTGSGNTALGHYAGDNQGNGTNNTFLGSHANITSGSLTNATAIGAYAEVGCDSCLVLGDASKVGIGTTIPQDKLHVNGNIRMTDGNQAVGYVMTSDANGTASWQPVDVGMQWLLTGNSGTVDSTHFIGTTDSVALNLKVNGEKAGRIDYDQTEGNTLYGYQTANANTTGKFNTTSGFQTLYSNTSGTSNVAVGAFVLNSNTTGGNNIGNGTIALFSNTTGDFNTANGNVSLYSNTTGNNNTAIGDASLFKSTTGNYNVGTGANALYTNTTGSKNTAIGYYSDVLSADLINATAIGAEAKVGCDSCLVLGNASNVGIGTTTPADKLHLVGDMRLDAGKIDVKNTGGSVIIGDNAGAADDFSNNHNTLIGTQTGQDITGEFNAGIGSYSLLNNTTGSYNVGLGASSISNVTTGSYNTALGVNALGLGGSTDEKNTAIGYEAGNNITGSSNVFIGYRAGKQKSGSNQLFIENSGADKNNALIYGEFDNNILALNANVGVGTSSPADKLHLIGNMRLDAGRIDVRNTGGSIIIGEKAGLVDDFTANRNVFIGYESGETTTSGTENTALGAYSLSNNTTGNYNTALGKSASAANTTGAENVAVGKFALFENETGNNNTAIGANALDWGGSADANNTALGFEAGWDATGSNNVYLGFRAGKQRAGSNRLFIENSSADKDNALIYGEFDNDLLALNANVGIGTTNPLTMLHVQSSSTSFGWTPFSQTSAIFEQNAGSILSLVSGNTAVSSIVMGDTDAQFMGRVRYEHDTDRMEFWTANSEKVVIQSNGNVGIGTSSATTKLHVNGSVRIQDGTQGDGKVLTSNANGTASWQTSTAAQDDQTIDQFTISNDTLQLSLEGDGQAPQTVSLVGYKVPVGTITMFIGDDENIPDGWLLCDGTSFSGATYPELQSIVGGTNTPNFKGRFPLGAKPIVSMGETQYPLKGTGGEEEVTLTIDEIPAHTHGLEYTQRSFSGSNNGASDFSGSGTPDNTGSTGGGQAHNNMPPFYTVNFIIKAN